MKRINKEAKNILLGNNCFNCKFGNDIWRLGDQQLKCKKTRNINSTDSTCLKWKNSSDNQLKERRYYASKYKRDRAFFARTQKIMKKIKEKNTCSEWRVDD